MVVRSLISAGFFIVVTVFEQDHAKAARHFEIAAMQGYHRAQLFLGRMYYLGEGVETDYKESYLWLTLARAQLTGDMVEDRRAINYYLHELESKLTDRDIASVEYMAAKFQPR